MKWVSAVWRRIPGEALVWLTGIFALALYEPHGSGHITLCPFALAGFDYCPGCGLGRSISLLLHGFWRESFAAHPLGGPALLILMLRIVQLILNPYRTYGKAH